MIALSIIATVLALPVLALGIICWAFAKRDIALDLPGAME